MKPTLDQVADYASKFGRKGRAEIEVLNSLVPYLEAVTLSEPGQVILADDSERCIILMKKSYMGELSNDERAELRYLKKRLDRIANKLNAFQSTQNSIADKMKV